MKPVARPSSRLEHDETREEEKGKNNIQELDVYLNKYVYNPAYGIAHCSHQTGTCTGLTILSNGKLGPKDYFGPRSINFARFGTPLVGVLAVVINRTYRPTISNFSR